MLILKIKNPLRFHIEFKQISTKICYKGGPSMKETYKKSDWIRPFNVVISSDINIRILSTIDKIGKISDKELLELSRARNKGIFEYNMAQLIRLHLINAKTPYYLTKLGKEITNRLKTVLP
jgi:hypothetical protein